MKNIPCILLVLLIISCSKDTSILSEPDFSLKKEEQTIFEDGISKTQVLHYSYYDNGLLKSITTDTSIISYSINIENLGSIEFAYVVAIENIGNSEITRKYFCDENKRVLREEYSDRIVKSFYYNDEGMLSKEIVKNVNGEPDNVIEYLYDLNPNNSTIYHDVITSNYYVKSVNDTWDFLTKRGQSYYYEKKISSSKVKVEYAFNFGKQRNGLLVKYALGPVIEGSFEETFYSYKYDKMGNILEKKGTHNGKYTEITKYYY